MIGPAGRGRQQIGGGASTIAGDLCQIDQCLVLDPSGSFLGHLVIRSASKKTADTFLFAPHHCLKKKGVHDEARQSALTLPARVHRFPAWGDSNRSPFVFVHAGVISWRLGRHTEPAAVRRHLHRGCYHPASGPLRYRRIRGQFHGVRRVRRCHREYILKVA